MKYKLLDYSHDYKIVGVKDLKQVEFDEQRSESSRQLDNIQNPRDYDFGNNRLDLVHEKLTFRLRKGALLTDYITYSPYLKFCSFIASESLANVFMEFEYSNTFFKEVSIFDPRSNHFLPDKFYLFQVFPTYDKDVDFQKSVFFNTSTREDLFFSCVEELNAYEENHFLQVGVKEIIFRTDELNDMLIVNYPFARCLMLSDKLANRLSKHQFTNLQISI